VADPPMDETAKGCLRELVAKHRSAVYADSRRCEAFLRDMCPDSRREISVLSGAVREGVPEDLLNSSRGEPICLIEERLAQRLSGNLAFDAEAARWAVATWASALGLSKQAETRSYRAFQAGLVDRPLAGRSTTRPMYRRTRVEGKTHTTLRVFRGIFRLVYQWVRR
jgi:hypothetical protein